MVFLGLLLFAVQALFNLYATSVVTAVAYDAARRVAVADGGQSAMGRAEADARRELGRYGARVTFDWSASDDEFVGSRCESDSANAFDHVDRTVRVRVEDFQTSGGPSGAGL